MAPTLKDLQAQLRLLRAENKALKAEGLQFFHRLVEKSEAAEALRDNKVPYFLRNEKLSLVKEGEPVVRLVEGDNLGVLVACQAAYKEKVDVIYIDPPYNTRKSVYSYSDSYNYSQMKRSNDRMLDNHSSWLSFMEVRLLLAKELMRDTGVMIVSVGIGELAHLKLLMDSIFGEDNLIANITVEGMLKNNTRYVSASNDYMLVYCKDLPALKKKSPRWRTQKPSARIILNRASEIWNESQDSKKATSVLRRFYRTSEAKEIFAGEPGLKMYNSIDENGRLYRAGDLSSPGNNGGTYSVVNPNTGGVVAVPARGWVHSEATFQDMIDNDEILWNENAVPSYKRYLDKSTAIVLKDIVKRDRDAPNRLLQKMIGRDKFTFPKDHTLLAEWIDYVTPDFRKADKEDPPVILDFFAGSGTTGHAVATLNQEDGLSRECILVTNNENDIPRLATHPRMIAALTGKWQKEQRPALRGQLEYLKLNFSTAREEPKKVWDWFSYSVEYVDVVRSKIKELKAQNLL